MAMIGFILSQAANAARVQSAVTSKIEGVRVADVMDREPVAIPEGLSIEQALDQYFLRYRWPWFPVVDAAHRFRGLLERVTVDQLPANRRGEATVAEILHPDPEGRLFVREDEPLESLLTNETLRNLGALMAVDAGGRLSGVVTIDQVSRALRDRLTAG
jgi:predicted transcriptional regulator